MIWRPRRVYRLVLVLLIAAFSTGSLWTATHALSTHAAATRGVLRSGTSATLPAPAPGGHGRLGVQVVPTRTPSHLPGAIGVTDTGEPVPPGPSMTSFHGKSVPAGHSGPETAAGWLPPIPTRMTPPASPPAASLGSFCNNPCSPPLAYYGGSILHTPHVALIFWGPEWTDTSAPNYLQYVKIVNNEENLFRNLPGSGFNNILTQYYDGSGHVVNAKNTPVYEGATADLTAPPSNIDYNAEATEISNAINANPGWGSLSDALFVLLPQQGSTYSDPNLPPQMSNCAYHYVTNDGNNRLYAMEPYLSDSLFTACLSAYGSGNVQDAITVTSSHEYAEAVTDPWVNSSSTIAWQDQLQANEIGDLCAPEHVTSPSLGVAVQDQFDNAGYMVDSTQGCDAGSVSNVNTSAVYSKGTAAVIYGLGAVAKNNIWAVGQDFNTSSGQYEGLIEHWNGSKWAVVPAPAVSSSDQSVLVDLAVISSTDIWAAGYYDDTVLGKQQTLIENWNGTAWSIIPSANDPNGGSNNLYGIAAISSTDIWAFGETYAAFQPLLEHWDGSTWSLQQNPTISGASEGWLNRAVVVPGTSEIWAVGGDTSSTTGVYQMLTEHWTGSTWTVVSTPNPSTSYNYGWDIAAVSSTNVWFVGVADDGSGVEQTVVEHWTGSKWKIVGSHDVGTEQTNELRAIAAVSGKDIWAVGAYISGSGFWQTIWEHWDGNAWSVFPSPDAGTGNSSLDDVAAISTENVWGGGGYDNTGDHVLSQHYT